MNKESDYDKAYEQIKIAVLAIMGKYNLSAFQGMLILTTLVEEIRDLWREL